MTGGVPGWIAVFAAGSCFGSFFYTLALRMSQEQYSSSIARLLVERSACPCCGTPVRVACLVPIFGFLLSRGRCASCGCEISPAYPLMEALYGLLACLFVFKYGLNSISACYYLASATAISIAVVDVKSMKIPNTLLLVFLTFSLYPAVSDFRVLDNLYGLLIMAGFFIVILLLLPGSFGAGDVKLASAIGVIAGGGMAVIVLETALVSGAIIGVAYAMYRKTGLRIKMPFAPFLAFGLIVALLWGNDMIMLYYRIFF
jgi:prepilin signal peptidase PulO-like enzyme (type II secretory pathway)